MRIAVVLGILALCAADRPARAAEVLPPGPWKVQGFVGLNLAQSAFSDNWKGGDRGSIVWIASSVMTAERQFSTSYNMTNTLKVAFGQTSRQVEDPNDPNDLTWERPAKSSDVIDLESLSRWTMRGALDPYFAFKAESQFRDESSPVGTIWFNPIKLRESIGVARVLQKTESSEAITRVGFGLRETIGRAFTAPPTEEKDWFTAVDGGPEWVTTVARPLLRKRVLYKGSLSFFAPMFYSKSDELEEYDALADSAAAAGGTTHEAVKDYWKAIDINWENALVAQITKAISVSLVAQLIYDKFDTAAKVDPTLPFPVLDAEVRRNVRKAGQFREYLSLGITYQLF